MSKYTEPITIKIDEQTYNWSPEDGLLADKDDLKANGNEQVIRLFLNDLANEYGGKFPATPEGPYLDTDTFDIYTIVFLLETMFPDSEITYSGDVPTLAEMGIDGLPASINGVN